VEPFVQAADAKPDAKLPADHERDEAIIRGLRYLEREVFQLPDASGTPRKQFTVAATGLAFVLARDGYASRTDGKKMIERARAYLAKYVEEVTRRTADPASLPAQAGSFSSNHMIQYTWPLAMDAMFQGELHHRGLGRAGARKSLRSILPLLEEAQAPNGGWGHGKVGDKGRPRGSSKMDGYGGYPDTLQASTNIVATALGWVRPMVPSRKKDFVEKAQGYFRYAELANGCFPYDPSQRSAHMDLTGVSRAAGAVLAMRALGISWKDRGIQRALAYIDANFAYLSEGHGSSTFNLFLAAMLQRVRGEKEWRNFKRTFFRRIIDKQGEDGAFECVCEGKAFASTNDSKPFGGKMAGSIKMFADGTSAYVTALHTLILLLDRAPPKLLGKEAPAPAQAPITPSTGKRK
jgi:hypothetical protein